MKLLIFSLFQIFLSLSKNTLNASETTSTWFQLQISPQVFGTINYENFKVSIFQHNNNEKLIVDKKRFYYSPILLLSSNSSVISFNYFKNMEELRFKVEMWNDEIENLIIQNLKEKNISIESTQLSLLPIEQIKIEYPLHSSNYEVENKWVSYSNQPRFIEFKIKCQIKEDCKDLHNALIKTPYLFDDMEVYYSLESLKTKTKIFNIRGEHFIEGTLLSNFMQDSKENGYIYLQAKDFNSVISEISSSIIAEVIEDNEYVDQKDEISLSGIIKNYLDVLKVTTENFNSQLWDSVFWQNENSRPDKIVSELNKLYEKSDNETKSSILKELENSQKTSGSASAGLKGFGGSGSANHEKNLKSKDLKDIFSRLIAERNLEIEIKGEIFVPKPMELFRINTQRLKDKQIVSKKNIKITYVKSVLKNKINIPINLNRQSIDRIGYLELFNKKLERENRERDNLIKDLKENFEKQRLESGGRLGEIRYSILSPLQFQNEYGTEWILLNGSSIIGSDLHKKYDWTKLPDARGIFLRSKQNGRSDGLGNPDGDLDLGQYQKDIFERHTHVPNTRNRGQPGTHAWVFASDGDHRQTDLNPANAGGNETRPKSITVNIYIKVNYKKACNTKN